MPKQSLDTAPYWVKRQCCDTLPYQIERANPPSDVVALPTKNPDFRRATIAVFDAQTAMRTLGISIARLHAGEADLVMDYSAAFAQQNGFVHAGIITAGLDNACGIAAYTLMAPDAAILTVEFKTNLLAPATRERFVFRAQVVKPGRTLTVCEARAYAIDGIRENLVASMTGTLMAPMSREERETEKPATAVA